MSNLRSWPGTADEGRANHPTAQAKPKKDFNPDVTVNATLYWAWTQKPSEMSGKYEVTIGNLSGIAVEKLAELAIDVRNRADKPEQGDFVTAKSTRPIQAYDTDGNEVTELIGNGTKAKVKLSYYDWEFKGKKGRSASIVRLTVTDLVPLGGNDAGTGDGSDDDIF